MDTLTTDSTELVSVTALDSDTVGSSNTTTIASAALAVGVLVGVFGVPPVHRIVKGWFTKTKPEEKALEEILQDTPAPEETSV